MKLISLSLLLLLVSCGTTTGVRITQNSMTVANLDGFGEDALTSDGTLSVQSPLGTISITRNTTGKNQSNSVRHGGRALLGVTGINAGADVINGAVTETPAIIKSF